ncbi:MAG: hypothetical protein ABI873_02955 [Marmoricola sp.]
MQGDSWDRLTFGPARRRRSMHRQLRELDRRYAAGDQVWLPVGPVAPVRRRSGVPLGRTLVAALVSLLAGVSWLYVFAPEALPQRLLVGLGVQEAPLPSAPHIYRDGSYKFLRTQPGNSAAPVGYNPCRKILVVVNLKGAPTDGMDLVSTAIDHIHRASGLDLRYAGPSSKRPGRGRSGPVLVSWADPTEVPDLRGDTVGVGGSGYFTLPGSGTVHYSSGEVTLDAPAFARLGRAEQQAVVDHEFGHVVGLAHVADRNELMYRANVGLTHFGHGDLTGLALLGKVPCR